MIPPCSTKMMRTLDDEAPIVLRIAMSRLFSMTRSTSDATMLRAATIMMSPMAMPMAIFSSHRAENSAWFNWPQSSAKYSAPRESVTARATAGASSRFSTRSSMRSTPVLVEQSAGHLEGDEAVGAVILPPPQVEDADHLKTLRPRYQPHRRRNHPLRRQHRDGVADRSAQGARQVLADDHSAEDAVARLGQRREAAPPDRVGDLRDLRLEHRIDPLER